MILSCSKIEKLFSDQVLFQNLSFMVNEKDRFAIIGQNGTGKTTLFKMIMGIQSIESGEIVKQDGLTIGYLEQNTEYESTQTLYETALKALEPVIRIENRILELTEQLAILSHDTPEYERSAKEYSHLQDSFLKDHGYSYQSRLIGVLKGLGFEEKDYSRQVSTFSGGQKTRIALAKILLESPDLLLLDEPTNHLDIPSVAFLEDFLKNYSKTIMVISHDRYFLDQIATKVLMLTNKRGIVYSGNYSQFMIKKQAEDATYAKQFENQQKEIQRQEKVIEQLRSFNREKSIKRAESREKMLDKVEKIDRPTNESHIRFRMTPSIESGYEILHAEKVSKSFPDRTLFKQVTFDIRKSDKIALIGDNGTGKSTLLKIINEKLPLDSGSLKWGSNVYKGYYDQEHSSLNLENTLIEEIQLYYPKMSNTEIRNFLANFLFTGDDVFKPISYLSGGERGRMILSKLVLSKANFLIMDEPTNHLDIDSCELLEEVLQDFTGTLLFVSHDRYFINKLATRIFVIKQDSFIQFDGNYDDYIQRESLEKANISSVMPTLTQSKEDRMSKKQREKDERMKQTRIQKIMDTIESNEVRLKILEPQLYDESIYSDHIIYQSVENEIAFLKNEIEILFEELETLHD